MNTAPPPYTEKIPFQQAPYVSTVQPVYSGVSPIITGDFPTQCVCPQCRTQVVTRTEKKVGLLAWIICIALFFTLMWVCCFIPFCVDACKDTEHYCPSCGASIGVNKRV